MVQRYNNKIKNNNNYLQYTCMYKLRAEVTKD